MKFSKKLTILFLLILFAILWITYFLNKDFFKLETFFSNLDIIQNLISKNFLISIFIFLFLYSLLIICNFPFASILSMINGFLFEHGLVELYLYLVEQLVLLEFFNSKIFLLDLIKKIFK